MSLLGALYYSNRNYVKAEQMLREALEIRRRLSEENPVVHEADVALSCNNLAGLLEAKGEYSKAEELYSDIM